MAKNGCKGRAEVDASAGDFRLLAEGHSLTKILSSCSMNSSISARVQFLAALVIKRLEVGGKIGADLDAISLRLPIIAGLKEMRIWR